MPIDSDHFLLLMWPERYSANDDEYHAYKGCTHDDIYASSTHVDLLKELTVSVCPLYKKTRGPSDGASFSIPKKTCALILYS